MHRPGRFGTPGPEHKETPLTAHGLYDATTGPAQIRAWWRRWPHANVAIRTGAPGPDVLDVDKHPGGDGFAAFNRLRRAGLLAGASALVRTRSGGMHAYYTGTTQQCGRLAAHHLDFKATGGYVIAPPSVVLGQPYKLLDYRGATGRIDWAAVRQLLDPPHDGRCSSPGSAAGDLTAWVARLPEGNRNSGLYWAACRAIESGADPAPLITASTLPEAEARRTITSAARRTR